MWILTELFPSGMSLGTVLVDNFYPEKLHFLYTQQGFVLDRQGDITDKEISKWIKRFTDTTH